MKELNDQERKFAQEMVNGLSITEAARRAGYAESTALKQVSLWLLIGNARYKPKLVKYIEELRAKIEENKIAQLQELLEFYTNVLRTNVDDIIYPEKDFIDQSSIKKMGSKEKSVIKKIKETDQGLDIEVYSKIDAAKELMKHHGGYAPIRREISGKDGGAISIHDKSTDYSRLSMDELETLLNLERKANDEKRD